MHQSWKGKERAAPRSRTATGDESKGRFKVLEVSALKREGQQEAKKMLQSVAWQVRSS